MKLILEDEHGRVEHTRLSPLFDSETPLAVWLRLFRAALIGLEYHPDNVHDLLRAAPDLLGLTSHETQTPPPPD